MFREQLKRQRLQTVPDQQRSRLVILDMASRLAAAQHVVIHARHIVMHQRISMDQLDRCRRNIQTRRIRTGQLARRKRQQRTDAFAAIQHCVAHRFMQSLRRNIGARQQAAQHIFEMRLPGRNPALEIRAH